MQAMTSKGMPAEIFQACNWLGICVPAEALAVLKNVGGVELMACRRQQQLQHLLMCNQLCPISTGMHLGVCLCR